MQWNSDSRKTRRSSHRRRWRLRQDLIQQVGRRSPGPDGASDFVVGHHAGIEPADALVRGAHDSGEQGRRQSRGLRVRMPSKVARGRQNSQAGPSATAEADRGRLSRTDISPNNSRGSGATAF